MNSSGIKRGLATTAVSALAIAGIPFIASSASAVPGDTITVSTVGPVRSGGTLGGIFRLKVSPTVDINDLALASTDFTAGPNTVNQNVAIVSRSAAPDTDANDGLNEVFLNIRVTSNTPGDSFAFGIYEDTDGSTSFTAGEARTTTSGSTAGNPATVEITPSSQTAPLNTASGNYVAVVKDSAGRITQLSGNEEFDVTTDDPADATVSDATLTALEMQDGRQAFTAQGDTADLYTITVAGDAVEGPANVSGIATLDVAGEVATGITPQEVDVVTGADNRDGFGLGTNAATVRADQTAVTFNINSPSNAGDVVNLAVSGTGLTFGGETGTTLTTTLNAQGVGSITVTPDAGTIQNGDSFTTSGSGVAFTINFANAAVNSVDANANTYISGFGGTVSPVVTVLDQFGDPISGVFVSYQLSGGENAGAESARKAVGDNGQVTFDITDTKANAQNTDPDTITFRVYAGPTLGNQILASDNGSTIVYRANGQGADFTLRVDGQLPGSATYNPTFNPLTDTTRGAGGAANDSADESASIDVAGGTAGAPITVSADNGGLILKNGETRLSQASASDTGITQTDTFRVIGTEAGTVNVTVTTGGITKTAAVTVATLSQSALTEATAPQTARNIAVSGPESVVAGDVVEFTVVITDAFGNPVKNFAPANVNALLTGPAAIRGNSGNSNAAGEIVYSVELDQDARNPITLQVTGTTADFGAAANRLSAASITDDGTGLSASVNVATVSAEVVNLEELEQAVADAEQALADAEAALASANADLDVAQTELAVAQANVDALKERRADLRQKLNKAKRNDNKQKAKTTRKKLRAVKRDLRAANDAVTIATAKVAAEQVSVDAAQDAVDTAEENLAAAQAELDEAQN